MWIFVQSGNVSGLRAMCFPHSGRRGEEESASRRNWTSNRLVQVHLILKQAWIVWLEHFDKSFLHLSANGCAADLLNAKVNIMLIAVTVSQQFLWKSWLLIKFCHSIKAKSQKLSQQDNSKTIDELLALLDAELKDVKVTIALVAVSCCKTIRWDGEKICVPSHSYSEAGLRMWYFLLEISFLCGLSESASKIWDWLFCRLWGSTTALSSWERESKRNAADFRLPSTAG